MTRLGTENKPVPTTPVREGYIFTGRKITSQGGKQKGKIYTAEQDREIALFAQWGGRTRSFIEYNGMGQDSGNNYVKEMR